MYFETHEKEKRLFVKIVFSEKGYQALGKTYYYKNNMSIVFFQKWKWYFLYREALLRVKYPKAFIQLTHGPYDYILPEEEYRKKVHGLLLAAKRKRTEFRNKLSYAIKNWNEIFPIEDHPYWKKIQEKQNWYENQVLKLQEEYDSISYKQQTPTF